MIENLAASSSGSAEGLTTSPLVKTETNVMVKETVNPTTWFAASTLMVTDESLEVTI